MADAVEDASLKAGHAPAVKVGGMRVATHKATKEKTGEEKPAEEEAEEFEGPPKPDKHHQQILLSGAVTKGDKDFPEAAVRAIHEKPQASLNYRQQSNSPNKNFNIQQPRKQ